MTAAPARVLRLQRVLGELEVGCWGDLVLLQDGHVQQTWVGGVLGYTATPPP